MVDENTGPHNVDLHVGARVRLRRKSLGISQEGLGAKIGLTFQQVQKYERGANRISASKLYDIAGALKVSVAYFFDGLPVEGLEEPASTAEQSAQNFLMSNEGLEIAEAFSRIKTAKHRRKLIELVKVIAEDE